MSFALIFALVGAGFAHTSMQPAMSPELAEFVAAGGSLADICGSSGEQDGARGAKCEACRLMNASLIPRNCHAAPLTYTTQTRVLAFVAIQLHNKQPLDPARLTRAPPQA
jgi:hypothetical protein